MEPKKIPAINRALGYVNTPVGTVRVEREGVTLFATGDQLGAFAKETGVVLDADAVWVELDNAGRVLFALPGAEGAPTVEVWVDELLSRARHMEVEETFFRGYSAALKATGGIEAPAPGPTGRPPGPGSMREAVTDVLRASGGEWLTAAEVTARAPALLGRELVQRSVYNALLKEERRGTVRRWDQGDAVRFRLA
jgi:hypothetical protein